MIPDDLKEQFAAGEVARTATYAKHLRWASAYAWQLSAWISPSAHRLAARYWWSDISAADALDQLTSVALTHVLKAKTGLLFDWREATQQIWEEVMRAHQDLQAANSEAMEKIALTALRSGATLRDATARCVEFAIEQPAKAPTFLISDAVERAQRELRFEAFRGKRKSRTRAR